MLPLLLIWSAPPAHAQSQEVNLKPTQEKFTGKTASMVFDWSARATAVCLKARNSACDETKPEGERILGGGFLPNVLNWFQTHPSNGFKRKLSGDMTFLYDPKDTRSARYYVQLHRVGGPAWRPNNARNYLPAGVAIEGDVMSFNPDLPVVFRQGYADSWTVGGTSVTFTGLVAGATYRARIRAMNPDGGTTVSEWANAAPVATEIDPPAKPTGFSAIPADGAVVLAWNPPSSGGPIFTYVYRWSDDLDFTTWESGGAGGVPFVAPDGANPRLTIEGLTNGTQYILQLAAVNPKGHSEWSDGASATPRAFTLDVDNSGGAANGNDGILIARYLAGVRGAALGAGLNLSARGAETAENFLADGDLSVLDVDGNGAVTIHDGVLISRYLLGVRSRAATDDLTRGVAGITVETVNAIVDNLVNLGAPAP
ncbi:MAG: fibronectin type III domain-containing protein [Gammaproteobacteria bacterium]|nr:fibronectin type III domain-containing protein [Gammaproteobacteria bacterium]MDA7995304.1 fibronectin type III domain-containing protein [Gammaproteobacteria bacterium]